MTEVLTNISTSNEYTLVLQADKQQSVMTENPVIENMAEVGQEPATDHNTFHSSLRLVCTAGLHKLFQKVPCNIS